jgi:hypothetical protein
MKDDVRTVAVWRIGACPFPREGTRGKGSEGMDRARLEASARNPLFRDSKVVGHVDGGRGRDGILHIANIPETEAEAGFAAYAESLVQPVLRA